VFGAVQVVADGLEHVGDGRVALEVDVVPGQVLGRREPERHARGHLARRGTHDREPGRTGGIRDEAGTPLVEPEAAPDAAPQLGHRVPSARDQQQVGLDRLGGATGTGDVHRRDPRVAPGSRHRPAVADIHAERARRIAGGTALAHVDDGGDLDSRRGQQGRGAVTGVVRREEHGALAGRHAEAVRVRHRGRGQHHTGAVAVGERDRAFMRTRGQHDPPGPDMPQGGHRGGTFEYHHVPVVVDAERGGLSQDRGVRPGAEFVRNVVDPCEGRDPVDRVVAARRAAEPVALVDHHRAVASPDGRERLAQPGSPAADHQGVHVDVSVIRGRDAIATVGEHADTRPAQGIEMANYLDHRCRHDRVE
jgi:hypothetical protein